MGVATILEEFHQHYDGIFVAKPCKALGDLYLIWAVRVGCGNWSIRK